MPKRDYRKEAMKILNAKLGKDELKALKKKCRRKRTGRRKYKSFGEFLVEKITGIPPNAKVTAVYEEGDEIVVEAEHQTGTKIKKYTVRAPKPKKQKKGVRLRPYPTNDI